MRNFIYILFFLVSIFGFSQKTESDVLVQNNELKTVNIYPNPIKDKATIVFASDSKQTVTFTVTSIVGKIVYSEKISATLGKNFISFFRHRLPEGIYFYTLKTANFSITKKMVLE